MTTDVTVKIAVGRLVLTDFRCYARLALETDGRPVVLTGPNGAGKTNLLEALSFLVPGRGLRRARLDAVTRRDAAAADPRAGWAVSSTVRGPFGDVALGTGLVCDGAGGTDRRVVRVNGAAATGQAALGEWVSALWLVPEMERLFADGASTRRRFLDRLVLGFDPAHATRLGAYERAMRERNRLLRERRADPAWLGALEQRMAENGAAVAAARADVVARLGAALAHDIGPFPAARLAVSGDIEGWVARGPSLEAEDRFRAELGRQRGVDADAGRTTFGVHRSDLDVARWSDGTPAAQCSTGEQKALLISIILAHARLQSVERGVAPLLLLDEVAAHLDARRREALFDEICALDAQAWMTGTDAGLFDPMGERAQRFVVEDAAVAPC